MTGGIVVGPVQAGVILRAAMTGAAAPAAVAGAATGGDVWMGTAINWVAGLFKEGIEVDRSVTSTAIHPTAFHNAPHYAQGTPKTSGIPAILHLNEAVIPLSKGRKIGVELNGAGDAVDGGGGATFGDINMGGSPLSPMGRLMIPP